MSGSPRVGHEVAVTIGPLPSDSVTTWAATARRNVEALREQPQLGVPTDVIEAFERYVSMWAGIAADDPTFEWSGRVVVAEVRRLASFWALLANAARAEDHPTRVEAPPASAQPFYDALVMAMAEVVAADDSDRFADRFEEVAPAFDDTIPARGTEREVDRPTRVLLVDDTEDIRLLYRISLESQLEFEVFGEAGNGQEALDALDQGCPDAILLDIMMPVMDGLTALPLLLERCPRARVTVVSAGLTPELRQEALAKGASNVVDKQASLDDMRTLLAAG